MWGEAFFRLLEHGPQDFYQQVVQVLVVTINCRVRDLGAFRYRCDSDALIASLQREAMSASVSFLRERWIRASVLDMVKNLTQAGEFASYFIKRILHNPFWHRPL